MWQLIWVVLAVLIFLINSIVTSGAVETHFVYTAKSFLPKGAVIQEEAIELKELPKEKIEQDSYSKGDLKDILGKKVTISMLPGEQIRKSKLSKDRINLQLYSEVTVELDSPADAGRAKRGDIVNIWVDYSVNKNRRDNLGDTAKVEKVLTNVMVKSVRDKNNIEIGGKEGGLPRFVTFDATDDQIRLIKEKQNRGNIFLTVVTADDKELSSNGS